VPDGVPDDAAVFTEPLAAAFEIAEQVHMGPGTRVAVLGDGKLGLLCAQVVAGTGSDVVLIGRHEEKLALARRLGIRTASLDDLPHDVDVVVEATGSPSGMDVALDMVRPRGTVVMKSTTSSGAGVELTRAVVDEVTLVGSRCGPFPRALRALEEGAVRVRELVAERYPLNGGVVAMERAASPGVLKVLLDIGEE
jgi:alcohol dehydrogenase